MAYESTVKNRLAALLRDSGAATFVAALERRPEPPPLVPPPDTPWSVELSQRISSFDLEALCGRQLVDRVAASAVKSGLLLWNDDLDSSHTLSQSIQNVTGGYWHGIMHRREPDYSNSKYWFHQVGEHAIFADLKEVALSIAVSLGLDDWRTTIATSYEWNPFTVVDWCQEDADGALPPANRRFLRLLQLDEIRLLLTYSFKQATGRG